MSLREIRVYELPEIRFDEIENSDMMIIETLVDTWKISVADLKLLFGNENKIAAIYAELSELMKNYIGTNDSNIDKITSLLEEYGNYIRAFIQSISDIQNKNVILERTCNNFKKEIETLKNKADNVDIAIHDIDTVLDSLNERVTVLEESNATILNKLTANENVDKSQTKDISDILQQLSNIREDITALGGNNIENIENVQNTINKRITDMYEELLALIDDCHHNTPLIE